MNLLVDFFVMEKDVICVIGLWGGVFFFWYW